MKSLLVKAGVPLLIVIIAIVIAGGLIASRKPPEKKEAEQKAFLVDAAPVHKEDINFLVKSQGTVMPKVQTVLSAQVSGKVTEVANAFIEGGMFRKGDVLIQLEKSDYETDLKSAEASLAQAKAALEEEQARGKVAAEEWKTVRNSVAPELGLRKPQLAKEMANVRAAEAQLERAKRNLERTTIRAPYDGLVKDKSVDIGQFVGIGSQLGTIYGTDIAEVRMPLSDNDLAYLELSSEKQQGADVTLYAKVAGQHAQWHGQLVRNEGVVDSASRVVYAVTEIKDPYRREENAEGLPLKFGRFVQADIIGNRAEGLVVLPRGVLRLDGTVMVVTADRKLELRPVQVQRADETSVYISGGLKEGELVTDTAIPHPVDGMAVRLPGEEQSNGDEEDKSATEIASAVE